MKLGAGPLKFQNPYLVPEYNQPMNGKIILPDVHRPQLEGTNATEYKSSYETGTPDEIQIPTVVGGQYLGDDGALERFRATGERFKNMDDQSSYSKFYDTVAPLGLMEYEHGGEHDEKPFINDFRVTDADLEYLNTHTIPNEKINKEYEKYKESHPHLKGCRAAKDS